MKVSNVLFLAVLCIGGCCHTKEYGVTTRNPLSLSCTVSKEHIECCLVNTSSDDILLEVPDIGMSYGMTYKVGSTTSFHNGLSQGSGLDFKSLRVLMGSNSGKPFYNSIFYFNIPFEDAERRSISEVSVVAKFIRIRELSEAGKAMDIQIRLAQNQVECRWSYEQSNKTVTPSSSKPNTDKKATGD